MHFQDECNSHKHMDQNRDQHLDGPPAPSHLDSNQDAHFHHVDHQLRRPEYGNWDNHQHDHEDHTNFGTCMDHDSNSHSDTHKDEDSDNLENKDIDIEPNEDSHDDWNSHKNMDQNSDQHFYCPPAPSHLDSNKDEHFHRIDHQLVRAGMQRFSVCLGDTLVGLHIRACRGRGVLSGSHTKRLLRGRWSWLCLFFVFW